MEERVQSDLDVYFLDLRQVIEVHVTPGRQSTEFGGFILYNNLLILALALKVLLPEHIKKVVKERPHISWYDGHQSQQIHKRAH